MYAFASHAMFTLSKSESEPVRNLGHTALIVDDGKQHLRQPSLYDFGKGWIESGHAPR